MTRLQKMFIELSQYRTINELKKATSDQFVDDLFAHLAFDENGKVHTCGYFPDCKGCVIGCNHGDIAPYFLTVDYLNAEIDDSHPQQNSVSVMRGKALDYLMKKFDIAKKNHANPLLTALSLDEQCNIFEEIGLFEPHECHYMILNIMKGKIKK